MPAINMGRKLTVTDTGVRSFRNKIKAGKARFSSEHGIKPRTCYVSPATLQAHGRQVQDCKVAGIRVVYLQTLKQGEFWFVERRAGKRVET